MQRRKVGSLALAGVLVLIASAHADDAYMDALAKWRQEREADLKTDAGWLTVAGLFFLSQGKNTFGSDPINDIVLPSSAPAQAGTFELKGTAPGTYRVLMRAAMPLAVNGKETTSAELKPAVGGQPADQVTIGPLTLFVHTSGDRLAIRLRDKNSDIRRNFTGLKWFPPNAAYRVTGRFEPYAKPKTVKVPNILGDLETYTAPGVVAFTLNGQELKLEAFEVGTERKRFFFVFRDLTAGKETYPAARFLYADLPVSGETVLDFNKAYNPPCAFNPYTTCPLPTEQNRLRVRIEAGELDYHKPAATH
jgi:uncharacterized protein (DUF1684 family)